MKLGLTPEQDQIADTARQFLASELPLTARADGGREHDALWRKCAELGWFGLGIPEAYGGAGLGPVDEVLLFRELGRALAPVGFLAAVAGQWIAVGARDARRQVTLSIGGLRPGLFVSPYVLDAGPDGAVVVADSAGLALHEWAEQVPVPGVDPSVRLARGRLGGQLVRYDDVLLPARLELLVAAMQVGIAEAVRDMSVAYCGERTQFDRPIGAFQAVKHRCADMAVRAYAAHAQLTFAAHMAGDRAPAAALHAAAAVTLANEAAMRNCADNIQNHGAIGFTREHTASRYTRRAQVLAQCVEPTKAAARLVHAPPERYEAIQSRQGDWFASQVARREPEGRNEMSEPGARVRVIVDEVKCEGHALCLSYAPEVFDMNDEERAVVLREEVGDDLLASVENAVAQCPVQAIRTEGR
jgi:ferredoxin